MSTRTQAAEAYVKALRTRRPSATQLASQHLANDVVLVAGQWSLTPVFQQAGFGPAQETNGAVRVAP